MHKDNIISQTPRNLENDNYMVLYYNQDFLYLFRFISDDIDFIINKKNNLRYNKYFPLYVVKGYGIEIHFNKAINSLKYFFSTSFDDSMKDLEFVDLSNFDTSEVTDMSNMFHGCSSLKSVDLSNLNTSKVGSMSYMFYGCSSSVSIDLSNFNTSKVTNMNHMFLGCSSLESINLSNFNTSKVIYMRCMFYGCSSLEFINLSNFDTSKVTDMESMFYECSSLESIDISNFNTSEVTNMRAMFARCSSLISIDLSNFNTSKVTNMEFMFRRCSSLKSIDLSNFDTSKVINMDSMLYECSSLESIDLSNFDMLNCFYYNIFSDIDGIKYINLYNFKNDKIISYIFNNTNNSIFICQKYKIINNPKAYNCCDSNLKTYECAPSNNGNDIPLKNDNSKTNNIILTYIDNLKTDNINSSNNITNNNAKSSNSISIGAIIGILSGVEHEPDNYKDNPIIIIFQNPGLGDANIRIDSNKTINELIRFYFEISESKDLYGDESIIFLVGAKLIIPPYPKESIKTLKNNIANSESISIVVVDSDDKMKKIAI